MRNCYSSKALLLISFLIFGFGEVFSSGVFKDIRFVENKGQWNNRVRFVSSFPGGRIFVENNAITYKFIDFRTYNETHGRLSGKGLVDYHAVQLRFAGASEKVKIDRENPYPADYNFFTGRDKSRWTTGVKAYQKVQYNNLYDGIDLEIISQGDRYKYSFVVNPNANAGLIEFEYRGTNKLYLNQDGNLIIKTKLGEIHEIKPKAIQIFGNRKYDIPCNFSLNGNKVKFKFPKGYEKGAQLIISPMVTFDVLPGFRLEDWGMAGNYDLAGNGYSAVTVYSPKFPKKIGHYQGGYAGLVASRNAREVMERDIKLLKFDKKGEKLIYATFLGGGNNEQPYSLEINNKNEVLILGTTKSKNFPVSLNSYDSSLNGDYDFFVSKFSHAGNLLLASTLVGGARADGISGVDFNYYPRFRPGALYLHYGDIFRGEIRTDDQNNIFIVSTSRSNDFPTTSGSFQPKFGGGTDGVVLKLSSNLTSILWGTYIGGKGPEALYSMDIAPDDHIYLTGGTGSKNQVHGTNAWSPYLQGKTDGIVYRLKKDGSALLNSSYIGTNGKEQSYFVRAGKDGMVYLTGTTTKNTFPRHNTGYYDAGGNQFLVKLVSTLDTLEFSTVFGNRNNPDGLSPAAFDIDKEGMIYFAGWQGKTWDDPDNANEFSLKVTPEAYQSLPTGGDFYLAAFMPGMEALRYATYYGKVVYQKRYGGGMSRFDDNGVLYQSLSGGCGGKPFPVLTPNTASPEKEKKLECVNELLVFPMDVFMSRFSVQEKACAGAMVRFKNESLHGETYFWNFGDGDQSNEFNPEHIFQHPGKYTVTLKTVGGDKEEEYQKTLQVLPKPDPGFAYLTGDDGLVSFVPSDTTAVAYHWAFGDGESQDAIYPVHQYEKGGIYPVSLTLKSREGCKNESSKGVSIEKTTGLSSQSSNGTLLKVYPNPFEEQITLQLVLSRPGKVEVTLMDLSGKEVYSFLTQNRLAAGEQWLNVSLEGKNFEEGLYFLRIKVNQRESLVKLYKK